MHLVTRNDTSLAVGLIVGTIVVFRQPLHFVLEIAHDVETRYHLDLLPALAIITGVFIFHLYRRRQLSKAEALIASADAARARVRAEELERLVRLGQALANTLDVATLQQVLSRSLPAFARDRPFWVLSRERGRWQDILQDTTRTPRRSLDVLEPIADRAVASENMPEGHHERTGDTDTLCFAMHAGGAPIGVFGVDGGGALPLVDRRAIGAAAGVIANALRNVQLFSDTRDLSVRDRLTGCFNREHCLETLDAELRRARRSNQPLAILMFDVDNFKAMNDELGHLKGDEILRAIGAQLARLLRSSDVRCRYGGDEFLVILPDTHVSGAEHVAEMLRRELATLAVVGPGSRVLPVQISAGVALAAEAELDVAGLIKRADEALYRAKRAGRNRVSLAPTPPVSCATRIAPPNAQVSGGADSGLETILVADDEPLTRNLIRTCLEPLGHTILLAANGAEALNLAERYPGPIHLLVSDIVMPDIDGRELALRVQRVKPEIRTVFVSGFISPATAEVSWTRADAGFVAKPFRSAELIEAIRRQLERVAGPQVHRPRDPADIPFATGDVARTGAAIGELAADRNLTPR